MDVVWLELAALLEISIRAKLLSPCPTFDTQPVHEKAKLLLCTPRRSHLADGVVRLLRPCTSVSVMLAVEVGGPKASKIDRCRSGLFDGIIRAGRRPPSSTTSCSSRRMMSSRVFARPLKITTKPSR